MMEFADAGEITEDELKIAYQNTLDVLEDLEFRNMLSEEGDNLSAVLQITAGAGGTESCDWAAMLMRMYMMWSQKAGFKIKELNYQEGDVAGVKTVTLGIEGDFAFGWLKGENVVIGWSVFHPLTATPKDTPHLPLYMCIRLLMTPLKLS